VAPAVAKAAIESGVAKHPITDWEAYEGQLARRLGQDNRISRVIINKAKSNPKRVVFADAENLKVLKAAQQVRDEGIAYPILLGEQTLIRSLIEQNNLDLGDTPIIDPRATEQEELINKFV